MKPAPTPWTAFPWRTPTIVAVAVLMGDACHATALNDYLLGGDWPGVAVAALEANHSGATVLFVQGCGADCNPLPRGTVKLARNHGQVLAAAVEQVLEKQMQRVRGPLRTAFDLVALPFQAAPDRAELQRRLSDQNHYVRLHAQQLLAALDREGGLAAAYPYPIQVWQFGGNLTLIALAGEVVVDYALRFKARYGFAQTWVAAYSNEVPAYVPSRRVLLEGGYESGDAMVYFGHPAPSEASVEERIAAQVHERVQQVRPAVAKREPKPP